MYRKRRTLCDETIETGTEGREREGWGGRGRDQRARPASETASGLARDEALQYLYRPRQGLQEVLRNTVSHPMLTAVTVYRTRV